MPKQRKFDGQVYTFPDDASEAEMAAAIDAQSKPTPIPGTEQLGGVPPGPPKAPLPPSLDKSVPTADEMWRTAHPAAQGGALRRFGAGLIGAPVGMAQEAKTYVTNPKQWVAQYGGGGFLREPVLPLGVDGPAAQAAQGNIAGAAGSAVGGAATTVALGKLFGGENTLDAPEPAEALQRRAGGLGISAEKFLRNSAKKNYVAILKPSNRTLVPKAEQIAGEMAQEPAALNDISASSKSMLDKTRADIKEIGPEAGHAYDATPPVDPAPLYHTIEGLRNKFAVTHGPNGPVVTDPELNGALNGIAKTFYDIQDENGMIPARSLDDVRGKLFGGNVGANGHMRNLAPATAGRLENSVASSIRDVLDSANPSAARINQLFHMKSKVEDFMESARAAKVAADANIATGSSTGAGAAVKAAIPKPLRNLAFGGLFDSIAWNTVSATAKRALADAIANSDTVATEKILRSLPQQKQLGAGPVITPGPQDASGGRTVSDSEYAMQNGAPFRNQKLLPPSSQQFSSGGVVAPDMAGQIRRGVSNMQLGPKQLGQGQAPFTQGTSVPEVLGRPGRTSHYMLEAPEAPSQPGSPPARQFIVSHPGLLHPSAAAMLADQFKGILPENIVAGEDPSFVRSVAGEYPEVVVNPKPKPKAPPMAITPKPKPKPTGSGEDPWTVPR